MPNNILASATSDSSADAISPEFSTGYCLMSTQIDGIDQLSLSAILFIVLALLDFIAIFVMIVLVWKETLEKRAYQRAKGKPVKLLLTQDYLTQLRPPKKEKPIPVLPIDDLLFESAKKIKKASKIDEKGKNDQNEDEHKIQVTQEESNMKDKMTHEPTDLKTKTTNEVPEIK